jgi:hypothetical protein
MAKLDVKQTKITKQVKVNLTMKTAGVMTIVGFDVTRSIQP